MESKIMELHQNKDLFRDAVLAASQRFGIPEIYREISGKRFINTTSVLTVTLGRQENN
jgi:hypothetical protein